MLRTVPSLDLKTILSKFPHLVLELCYLVMKWRTEIQEI